MDELDGRNIPPSPSINFSLSEFLDIDKLFCSTFRGVAFSSLETRSRYIRCSYDQQVHPLPTTMNTATWILIIYCVLHFERCSYRPHNPFLENLNHFNPSANHNPNPSPNLSLNLTQGPDPKTISITNPNLTS